MPTVTETRHANLLQLIDRFGSLQKLADAIDRSHSHVSQLKNRVKHSKSGEPREMGDDFARHIEAKLGLSTGWMDTTHLGAPSPQLVAHPMSQGQLRVAPTISWEALMTSEIPTVFKLQLADNAMSPRAQAGTLVEFTVGLTPLPGDGVLVRDGAGSFYFREYRQGTNNHWEAHASQPAYRTLHSAADNLELVAVLTGISTRWGN